MKTIVLNGITWDTENLEVNGKSHFTYQEASEEASKLGKRLPTKEEFEELLKLPHLWDDDRHGMWFAENISDLKSNQSLFFPAAGFLGISKASLSDVGWYGDYWSDTYKGTFAAYSFVFSRSNVFTINNERTHGFTVRCVSK